MTTVTGYFLKPDGTAATDRVKFLRLIQPDIASGKVVAGQVTTLPDASTGAISIDLLAGDYSVFVGDDPTFITIAVPASGPVDIADISFAQLEGIQTVSQVRVALAGGGVATVTSTSVDGVPALSVN